MTERDTALGGTAQPLAVRMRPRSIDEVAGQGHVLRQGMPLWLLAQAGDDTSRLPSSVILWGPPGTGKTTIAHVIASSSGRRFVELSAVTAGVKDVRQVMEDALSHQELYRESTVLFLDEIHRFSKAQQDALLPGVENGWVVLVAATTENPSFSVISPLLSRSLVVTLRELEDADLTTLIRRAVSSPRGLGDSVVLDDHAVDAILELSSGDARRALTTLEAAAALAQSRVSDESTPRVTPDDVSAAVDRALLRYDRQGDQHYDVISAFIKSMRGSDPDAAIHYLARMLEAGEDPRFIARRIVVFASEDVGMADPTAFVVAMAAADAVAMIGLPEARINLAQAVIHMATAPKSNAVITAIDEAISDVRAGRFGAVPPHLRDAHYRGAKALGHGKGYRYPHDADAGVVRQQYPPNELIGHRYYRPTSHGAERDLSARLEKLRQIVAPAPRKRSEDD